MSLKSILSTQILSWRAVLIIVAAIYGAYYIFHFFTPEGKCERQVNEKMKIIDAATGIPKNETARVMRETFIKTEVRKCVAETGLE